MRNCFDSSCDSIEAPCHIRIRTYNSSPLRQYTSAYVNMRQHASAFASISRHTLWHIHIRTYNSSEVSVGSLPSHHRRSARGAPGPDFEGKAPEDVELLHEAYVSMRQHTLSHAFSIGQHRSA